MSTTSQRIPSKTRYPGFLGLLVLIACGRSPTEPRVIAPTPPPTPPAGTVAVWGDVGGVNTSGSLIGARVQVLDGPSAGVSVVVTANGNIERGSGYVIQGLPAGSVSLRASMPGYQDQTRTVTLPIPCLVGPVTLEECGVDFVLRPAT